MRMPKHLADRIEWWDDERGIGNSLIVTLKPGWEFADDPGCGTMGFDTVKDAIKGIREARKI